MKYLVGLLVLASLAGCYYGQKNTDPKAGIPENAKQIEGYQYPAVPLSELSSGSTVSAEVTPGSNP